MAPSFFFDFKKKVLTYHKAGQGYAKTNTTRSNEGSIPHPPADSQPHPAECLSCGGVCNKGPLAGVHTMEPCRRAHRNGVIPIGTSIGEVTGLSPFELGLAREVPAPPSARGAETGPSVCSTADARTARVPVGVLAHPSRKGTAGKYTAGDGTLRRVTVMIEVRGQMRRMVGEAQHRPAPRNVWDGRRVETGRDQAEDGMLMYIKSVQGAAYRAVFVLIS